MVASCRIYCYYTVCVNSECQVLLRYCLLLLFVIAVGAPPHLAAAPSDSADRVLAKMDSVARVLSSLDSEIRALYDQQRGLKDSLKVLGRALDHQSAVVSKLDSQYRILEAERQPLLRVLARSIMADLRLDRWAMLEILLGSENLMDFMDRRAAVSRMRDSAKRRAVESARGLHNIQALEDLSIDETRRLNEQRDQVQSVLTNLATQETELAIARDLARAERELLIREQKTVEKSAVLVEEQVKQKELAVRQVETIVESQAKQISAASATFLSLKGTLPWPVKGELVSRFGKKRHKKLETVTENPGIDLVSAAGVPVRAVAAGKVSTVTWLRGFGNVCIVQHEGDHHTVYARLSEVLVQQGDNIDPQTIVGYTGFDAEKNSYGMHFEVWSGKEKQDPLAWLGPAKK